MSSGKQISFAFGEVSPSLRFRSDATFYSQALSKLKNAYVRKSGGVSNRAGTIFLGKASTQDTAGVRIFNYRYGVVSLIVELRSTVVETSPGVYDCPIRIYYQLLEDTESLVKIDGVWETNSATYAQALVGDLLILNTATASENRDELVICVSNGGTYITLSIINTTVTLGIPKPSKIGAPAAIGAMITGNGATPIDIPVCYLITQEQHNGAEVSWQEGCYTGQHPHLQRSATITIDTSNNLGVKQYNIYRAAGNAAANRPGHYALVGRTPALGTGTEYNDYVASPDITVQPPTDGSLYPPDASGTNIYSYLKKVVFYKERTVYAYQRYREPLATEDKFVEGLIGCSKLGASKMFGRPLTPNLIDAFSFTTPINRMTEVTQLLVMNRLIIFTRNATYSIRGGEGGVLTSQNINPELIYDNGSSEYVAPVTMGSRGYFISNDGSKVLMIKYDRDDSVSVLDISTFSDHLFETKDIKRLAALNSQENILWMLKSDGTLISVTISDEGGVIGFSTHETDGTIEDIVVHSGYDGLYSATEILVLSVLREGERVYERLNIRKDILPKQYMFADSSKLFGTAEFADSTDLTGMFINIQNDGVGGDYLGGSVLTLIAMETTTFTADWVGRVYDFFYPVTDTETGLVTEEKIRLYIDTFVDVGTLTAHAEVDIPEYLQDVAAQIELTFEEQRAIMVKFLRAYNSLTGLEHLALKDVSVYADGQVISSPNNSKYDILTVDTNGLLTLPTYYNYGYVGLPYTTEIETLDLEASDARTFTDSGKLINAVGLGMHRTSGGFVGQTGSEGILNMEEITEIDKSGYLKVMFPSSWEPTGRVLIKQVDPLPMSILSVYPKGVAGD